LVAVNLERGALELRAVRGDRAEFQRFGAETVLDRAQESVRDLNRDKLPDMEIPMLVVIARNIH